MFVHSRTKQSHSQLFCPPYQAIYNPLVHSSAFVVHSQRGRHPAYRSAECFPLGAALLLGQNVVCWNLYYRPEPPAVPQDLTFTNTCLSAARRVMARMLRLKSTVGCVCG